MTLRTLARPLVRALPALLLALLALAAPLPAQEADAGNQPAAEAAADTVAPATAGELRSLADSLAGSLIEERRTGGLSVMVLRGADTLVHRGFGRADLELDVAAEAGTVYRIGSVTKQFTAALVQRLAAAGTLSVDDRLSRWVEVPEAWRSAETPVTVRHLLTHTSGIPSYTGKGEFWSRAALPLSHEEVVGFVREDSLEFTPGTDWSYSNTGYYLLGMVIEEATGRRYDRVLRDSLLAPLGLERTGYCWQAPLVEGRAEGYTRSDSVPGMGRLEEERLLNARPLSLAPPFAAGALCSTVGELVQWTRALHGGEVLAAPELEEMTTPGELASGEATHYGFGLSLGELEGHRRVAHGGGINGFSASLAHYPEGEGTSGRSGEPLTVAVLINSDAVSASDVSQTLARAALGIPAVVVEDRPVPAALAERVAGRYVIGGRLPAEVRAEEGRVFVQARSQPEFRLLFQGVQETDDGPMAVFRAEFDPEAVKLEFVLPGGASEPAADDEAAEAAEAAAEAPAEATEASAPAPAFILHQGGGTVRAERAEGSAGEEESGEGS